MNISSVRQQIPLAIQKRPEGGLKDMLHDQRILTCGCHQCMRVIIPAKVAKLPVWPARRDLQNQGMNVHRAFVQ